MSSHFDESDCISNCPYCHGEPELIESYIDRVKYRCAECGYYCGPEVLNTGDYEETCIIAAQEWDGRVGRESQSSISKKLARLYFVLGVDVYNHIRLIHILREDSENAK